MLDFPGCHQPPLRVALIWRCSEDPLPLVVAVQALRWSGQGEYRLLDIQTDQVDRVRAVVPRSCEGEVSLVVDGLRRRYRGFLQNKVVPSGRFPTVAELGFEVELPPHELILEEVADEDQ